MPRDLFVLIELSIKPPLLVWAYFDGSNIVIELVSMLDQQFVTGYLPLTTLIFSSIFSITMLRGYKVEHDFLPSIWAFQIGSLHITKWP